MQLRLVLAAAALAWGVQPAAAAVCVLLPLGAGSGLRLSNLPSDGWKQAASGFLSVDTRFGPFYLALGATRRGHTAAYLLLKAAADTWRA